MKRWKYGRGLVLAVLILAAGCSYSCGMEKKGELLESIPAPEKASETASESRGIPETLGETLAETETPCFVHVCGAVEKPGVYELEAGQRVYEAIALAGGFTQEAARDYLNLAETVWDGMKLEVPNQEQVPVTEWPAAAAQPGADPGENRREGAKAASASGKVNLNTATREELMTLSGIGEARAEEIIRYRQEQGGFGCIEDIMQVSGIKNGAFEKIKDDITV